MRKIVLCLLLIGLTCKSFSQGPLTKNWEKLSAATGSIVGTAGLETTIAYNKVTDKLYLPERNNKISIINPSDGSLSSPATLTTLTTAPAWTQSFKYTKIRVTDDGVIYACNMTTGAGTVYIYRWASETDATPTTSAITVTARTGDSFAVTGTGVNTIIYLSGSANNEIYVCKTSDGVNFTLDRKITGIGGTSTSTHARSSISAVSNSVTSDLWINTLNVEARRITVDGTGAITATSAVASVTIDQIYSNAEYLQEGPDKFLAVTGAHNATLGIQFKLYKITNFSSPPTTGVTEVGSGVLGNPPTTPFTYVTNANGYADVAYKKNANGTYTFYNLICNNGMAAYTTASTLPVSLTSFTAGLSNGVSKLSWTTTSESNNSGFEIQKSTDGQEFTAIGFVASKAAQGNSSSIINYSYEDKAASVGTQYYRLKQIDLNGDFEYSAIKSVNISLSAAEIKIYPNPVGATLSLDAPLHLRGANYKVYNLAGQELLKGKIDGITQIEVSNLLPSTYFIKIISAQKEIQSLKFIKQ